MNHSTFFRFLSGLLVAALISGCSDDPVVTPPATNALAKYNSDVPTGWFDLQMVLIQYTPGFTPPVSSRALGYAGVTLYEALVPAMSDRRSLVGQLNGLTSAPQPTAGMEYHWPTVANSAMARITKLLYGNATATYVAKIDSLENYFTTKFTSEVDAATASRSAEHGVKVADAIFEWSKTDGGHEGYSKNFPASYVPPTGPGMWVPTPRPTGAPQTALQPYWGDNRPFVLTPGNPNSSSDPGAHPAYSEDPTSDFYKEGLEVYNTVKVLSADQNSIALFWADDAGKTCTPPGHSISILSQCIRMKSKTLDFAAENYAKLGIGIADAFIACWQTKYKYNLLRPITYIQKVIDSTWNTPTITDPVVTPPFPEYTSGHSVQSGTAARILTEIFGENFSFTDHTHDAAGRPSRSYTSFYQCADEAALSRLYGGIHFRSAIDKGVEQGKKIGAKVLTLQFKK